MEQLDATAVAVFVRFYNNANSMIYVEYNRVGESWDNTIDRLYWILARQLKSEILPGSIDNLYAMYAKEKGFDAYKDGFLSQQDLDEGWYHADCAGLSAETLRIHMLDEDD